MVKEDRVSWRPSLPASLGLGCYLIWMNASLLRIDQADWYGQSLFVCLSLVVGVLAIFFVLERRASHLEAHAAALFGLVGAAGNVVALCVPAMPISSIALVLSNLSCGCASAFWAHHLSSTSKGRITPTIAIAGLLCSLSLLVGLCGTEAFDILLIAGPLACSACLLASREHEHPLPSEAVHDKYHTAWPLPCALLICALGASVFTSMLSSPFVIVDASVYLYESCFGTLFCVLLLAWTFIAKRRNLNFFILLIVIVLEVSLLIFATGVSMRIAAPINMVCAVSFALTFLVWILAAFLARSPLTSHSYRAVFACFLACGTGALGHAAGYLIVSSIKVPYAATKVLSIVLLVGFAILLLVFFTIEVTVVRRDLEREAALRVDQERAQAAEQVLSAREEAARDVKQIQQQANAQVKMTRQECFEHIEEKYGLTQREGEAVELLSAGRTRAEIAAEWVVSENTVKYHLRNAYRKLDVHNARELAALVEAVRTNTL